MVARSLPCGNINAPSETPTASKTTLAEPDEVFKFLRRADQLALDPVPSSTGGQLVTPNTSVPGLSEFKIQSPGRRGSASGLLRLNKCVVPTSPEEPEEQPYTVKNTEPVEPSNSGYVSMLEEGPTNSGAPIPGMDNADRRNARVSSTVDTSQPQRVVRENNVFTSKGVTEKNHSNAQLSEPKVAARRLSDGSGSDEPLVPTRTDVLTKRTRTREDCGVIYSFALNNYCVAMVLLASIVLLAFLPSGGTTLSASADGDSEPDPVPGANNAHSRQALGALNKVDTEHGSTWQATSPDLGEPAVWATGAVSRLLFVVNFVLWVSLAMGFSAYAKGYLRETREPVGLVVLQGATGIAVLGTLGRAGKLNLYPSGGYTPAAARRVKLAAVMHTGQALLTNFAVILGGVAATNALKTMEPIAAAAFSYFLLGEKCSGSRLASIFISAAGIIMFTATSSCKATGGGGGEGGGTRRGEVGEEDNHEDGSVSNREMVGISSILVMAAVCCNALRNVFIKKGDPIPPHQTLFSCSVVAAVVGIGMMSLRLMFVVMDDLALVGTGEGERTGRSNFNSSSSGSVEWLRLTGVNASLCFVGYNLASFNLLVRLTPVGHAIGNSFKRVLVIAGGLLFLGEFMNSRQVGGAALALAGVLAYNVS